ncbi:MAG: 2-C-methyl-D-erythritol 2,4-cyclodiphosphate synthase [Halofilum sp. (in: g-proteobacteria)]
MRIGHGYDIHASTEGDHVVLGGVRIACDFGLRAHSDGDVLLHALTDALLGAVGMGDIGRLFPDSDPTWCDADSRELLADVVARVHAAGWMPVNADLTLIAERPRIGPHVDDMRAVIGELLGLDHGAVNVKATTHEGVGGVGRGEGIAAHAVVLMDRA